MPRTRGGNADGRQAVTDRGDDGAAPWRFPDARQQPWNFSGFGGADGGCRPYNARPELAGAGVDEMLEGHGSPAEDCRKITREVATQFGLEMLRDMQRRGASDMYLTAGYPPLFRVNGALEPHRPEPLDAEEIGVTVDAMMNDRQRREFDSTRECNFAINPRELGRFRVSAFVQQGLPGLVLRTIPTEIPTIGDLRMPRLLKRLAMIKRGMIIVVGATGSGKSTTLAAMVDYRNRKTQGHILTIEDPIEFVHQKYPAGCVVNQREVGADTGCWENALKNSLRQAPDVIQIGEIRCRETMEFAVQFAETGHLCLSTLHANNANQALDRIINLFPEERKSQVLLDLSFNLKAVVSQRLIRTADGQGRVPAVEILLNTPFVADLIQRGRVGDLKEAMQKGTTEGMQTFDQSLFDLYERDLISEREALANADSENELRLRIKLQSRKCARPSEDDELEGLSLAAGEEEKKECGRERGRDRFRL